jgi:hypothetical protein
MINEFGQTPHPHMHVKVVAFWQSFLISESCGAHYFSKSLIIIGISSHWSI